MKKISFRSEVGGIKDQPGILVRTNGLLVCKILQTEQLKLDHLEMNFITILEARSPRSRELQGWFLLRLSAWLADNSFSLCLSSMHTHLVSLSL
jgi:hypothetical protein